MMVNFDIVREAVKEISSNYFEDHSKQRVKEDVVDNWNVLIGVFTYLGNKNAYLVGDPGTGKTTFACVVESILSGLPFDLLDALKQQGHPEQTKDTLLARADLGDLANEGVVWQASDFLPAGILDEINRLPPGKQAISLEYIRTGLIEHLSRIFRDYDYIGLPDGGTKKIPRKKPFFATVNYNGAGTYPLPPAALDRFDINLEFRKGPSFAQDEIRGKAKKIKLDLIDVEKTDDIIAFLLRKNRTIEERLNYVSENCRADIPKSTEWIEFAEELPWNPHAKDYLRCLWDETVYSPRYGENRMSDIQDQSDRAKGVVVRTDNDDETQEAAAPSRRPKGLACYKVRAGMSPRNWDAINFYAGMLAGYLGSEEVKLEHVMAVAPYTMAHRMEFYESFSSKFAGETRLDGDYKELDLAKRLLKDVKENYDLVADEIKKLDSYISADGIVYKEDEDGYVTDEIDEQGMTDVETMVKGPEPDHPYFKLIWKEAKRVYDSKRLESAD